MKSSIQPERRALTNEAAFAALTNIVVSQLDSILPQSLTLSSENILASFDEAKERIAAIEGLDAATVASVDEAEHLDMTIQFQRLLEFFRPLIVRRTLMSRPYFSGCGILDGCYGDFCTQDHLFEIKSGQRLFRSSDLRQMILYIALRKQMRSIPFSQISLFNPRVGISFSCTTDELCFEMSGRNSGEFLHEVIEALSGNGISR